MNIRSAAMIAGGLGIGVAAGYGTHVGVRSVMENINEGTTDKRYAKLQDKPDGETPRSQFPHRDEGQEYSEAFIPAITGMAGIFAFAGAVASGFGPVKQAGLGIAAGALMGIASGYFAGLSRGEDTSDARNGVDIVAQSEHIIDAFDVDGDGELNISYDSRSEPTHPHPSAEWHWSAQDGSGGRSVETQLRKVDADGDLAVTTRELADFLTAHDADHNGKLSKGDELSSLVDATGSSSLLSRYPAR